MKHNKQYQKLSRDASHRIALLRNLSKSLFEYKYMVITMAKCRALRPFLGKLISRFLKQSSEYEAMRYAKSNLAISNAKTLKILMDFYAENKDSVKPNYLRHKKLFMRRSDNSIMYCISLIQES